MNKLLILPLAFLATACTSRFDHVPVKVDDRNIECTVTINRWSDTQKISDCVVVETISP